MMAAVTLTTRPCAAAVKRGSAGRTACAYGAGMEDRPPELLTGTGNDMLDAQLIATHEEVCGAIGVDPAFGVMEDSRSPNALAIDDALAGTLRDGKRGTVLLGRDLTLQALADNHWGSDVVRAVLAHEAAHIRQFNSGLFDRLRRGQPNARLAELHADYLAGYHLGQVATVRGVFYELARESFYLRGDTAFQDPGHHGTPDERTAALTAGFEAASEFTDPTAASAAGARWLQTLAG